MGSSATRPTVDARHARSKVTNGKRLFADMTVDGRSGWSRRLRDLLQLHVADLGGEDVVSTAEHSLCRRISTITVELELLERKFALKGKGANADDLALYITGANSLRRLLESIGLKRVARDVTPLIQDYINRPSIPEEDPADVEDVIDDVEASP
jgi:hypothetical protein